MFGEHDMPAEKIHVSQLLWNYHDFEIIKAMLGMLGGGENMSENLSGCLCTLGRISLHKGMVVVGGGGGGRQNLSQSEAEGFQSVCQPML